MTLARRNRFYKRVFLTSVSIPGSDIFQELQMEDADGNIISNKIEFPSNMTSIQIVNSDNTDTVEFSFDGRNLDGELLFEDGALSQDCTSEGYLYLRLPEGTVLNPPSKKIQVRIWAWRGGAGR